MKTNFLCAVAGLSFLALGALADDVPKGTRLFSFSDCRITCIQDTEAKHPQRLFSDTGNTGFQQQEKEYASSINVFLVEKAGKRILIDTGNDPVRGSLREKLRQLGMEPESIDDIFITHIHPDHVGGLLWNGQALFSRATLHIAKEELEAWQKDANRNGLAKYIAPYKERTDAFEYEKPLPCGLIPVKRGGHTPGHTIFRLALAKEKTEAIFVGDIVHAVSLQFPHPTFCARYDASPKEAVASRIQTLQMKGLLFGAHFPFPGVAKGGEIAAGAPSWAFTYRVYVPLKK